MTAVAMIVGGALLFVFLAFLAGFLWLARLARRPWIVGRCSDRGSDNRGALVWRLVRS